jgi:hypothetical protein
VRSCYKRRFGCRTQTNEIDRESDRLVGNAIFQASTTIWVASSNDFGGGGLLLALCVSSSAVDTEDGLAFFLAYGAGAIWDCAAVRLRERLLLSGLPQSD